MSRTLLDSNLIIYAAQPSQDALRSFIAREVPFVSVVSKVETLGHLISTNRKNGFLPRSSTPQTFFPSLLLSLLRQSDGASGVA